MDSKYVAFDDKSPDSDVTTEEETQKLGIEVVNGIMVLKRKNPCFLPIDYSQQVYRL